MRKSHFSEQPMNLNFETTTAESETSPEVSEIIKTAQENRLKDLSSIVNKWLEPIIAAGIAIPGPIGDLALSPSIIKGTEAGKTLTTTERLTRLAGLIAGLSAFYLLAHNGDISGLQEDFSNLSLENIFPMAAKHNKELAGLGLEIFSETISKGSICAYILRVVPQLKTLQPKLANMLSASYNYLNKTPDQNTETIL